MVYLSFASVVLVLGAIGRSLAAPPDTCENPLEVVDIDKSFTLKMYEDHLDACTAECNIEGYCCKHSSGSDGFLPCTTGCHISWFTDDVASCKAECNRVNSDPSCSYTWNHAQIINAGYNPSWRFGGIGMTKCSEKHICGCRNANFHLQEKQLIACERGCEIAEIVPTSVDAFRGPDSAIDPQIGLLLANLTDSIASLQDHLDGTTLLAWEELVSVKDNFYINSELLDTDFATLDAAFKLVNTYETQYGALFINSQTNRGLKRKDTNDGKTIHRTMITVQQAIIDEVYQGTLPDKAYQGRVHENIISNCDEYLRGRYFQTANFFPGFVDLPIDPTVVHSIDIWATMNTFWGTEVCFATKALLRPTGLYLSPGGIATLTFPSALVNAGFQVQVGASRNDHIAKHTHRRLDRVTSTYEIKSTTIQVATPLGGALYIVVPYDTYKGMNTIVIRGDVVKAPYLSLKQNMTTTEAEWDAVKNSPAPWADFVTDTFFMQVPSSWISDNNDYNFYLNVLQGRDDTMRAINDFLGFPTENRNDYTLYLQPDLQLKSSSHAIGYPQVNALMASTPTGTKPYRTNFLVTEPYINKYIEFHELGHCILKWRYRGEKEAINNFIYPYIMHTLGGVDFDYAFATSQGSDVFTPDDAALFWMITANFRNGAQMDHSNSKNDEFRYQHRGYAKYADIYKIFGDQPFKDFHLEENMNSMQPRPDSGLGETDDRTLRLSIAAGSDLTPLIHFWGIHPVDPVLLKAKMQENGLMVSPNVFDLIVSRMTMVPRNGTDFIDYFARVYPGKEDKAFGSGGCVGEFYGCGSLALLRDVWDESLADEVVTQTWALLEIYFPESSAPSLAPSTLPTNEPSSSPSASPTNEPSSSPSELPTTVPTVPAPDHSYCEMFGARRPCNLAYDKKSCSWSHHFGTCRDRTQLTCEEYLHRNNCVNHRVGENQQRCQWYDDRSPNCGLA